LGQVEITSSAVSTHNLNDRAARYSSKTKPKPKSVNPILVAYVAKTPKGKTRLRRVGIRFQGQKEEVVSEVSQDDPRFVFEDDYKVRKATHEVVKKSSKFGRFFDASARVVYEPE